MLNITSCGGAAIIANFIRKFYGERLEDFCTRLLYFTNTIDTYCPAAAALSYVAISWGEIKVIFVVYLAAGYIVLRFSDFHPAFALLSPAYVYFFSGLDGFSAALALKLVILNSAVFASVQMVFMGVPDSIVARDISVLPRKLWNSIFTVAPTTVSFSVSVFFSTILSWAVYFRPDPTSGWGALVWASLAAGAALSRLVLPKNKPRVVFMPKISKPLGNRLLLLNIDGCRLDRRYQVGMPNISALEREGSYFPAGLETVYKALTNPAFASILTGAPPRVHGIKNNGVAQKIRVEGLPDIVPTILYGSMHVKHFSKRSWQTKIVSLPAHSVYKADDVMLQRLKEDIIARCEVRLFVADLSEVDFLGHAYGSESSQYAEALRRADERIGDFIRWAEGLSLLNEMAVIVCSDHGIVRIDHSYLFWDAEKYVPFVMVGPGVKMSNPLKFKASIMDIAPTISYYLGAPYPASCRGRALTELFKG